MDRFWSKVDRRGPDECWLWTAFTEGGYGMFWLDGRPQRAPRVAWKLTHGSDPGPLFVLHGCDVRYPADSIEYRKCVNPAHLRLGTNAENMADMARAGRSVCPAKLRPEVMARGEDAGKAKLTTEKVRAIRAWAAQGISQRDIGFLLDIEHKTAGAVLRGKTWAHVPPAGAQ